MFLLSHVDESHKAGYASTIIVSPPISIDVEVRFTAGRLRKVSSLQFYDGMRAGDSKAVLLEEPGRRGQLRN